MLKIIVIKILLNHFKYGFLISKMMPKVLWNFRVFNMMEIEYFHGPGGAQSEKNLPDWA